MAGTQAGRLGRFVETAAGGERVRAFVPPPLPPDPGLELSSPFSLYDSARGALGRLIALGIVHEVTGKQRNRVFAYRKYLEVLDRGTEPLPG